MSNNYSIFYTPTFESDIDNIISYIAEDNPVAAYNLIEKFQNSISILSGFPYKGAIPNYAQLRLKGIRLLIIDNYIIFYRPDDKSKTVSILRILSSYQNYIDLL